MSPPGSRSSRLLERFARAVEEGVDVLSIAQLYNRLDSAIARAFPAAHPVWIRGEVQTISDRTGHCYFDLVDPASSGDRQGPVLKVRCWQRTWGPLRAALAREGIELATGMVVHIVGSIDFYRPRAEIGFIMHGLDVTALLGARAAERAALLAALSAEGLLDANQRLEVPPVPLRIGLVGSPGTEGYRDFVGQLTTSGYGFSIAVAKASVQGAGAPGAIARAIRRSATAGCDLVVLVRGGGSKADLSAFDAEPVARAIAGAAVPVWTGIGHTGDQSVADVVANRSFVTPTECGHELVTTVAGWWQRCVLSPRDAIVTHARRSVDSTQRHLHMATGHLSGSARQQLRWHGQRLEHSASTARRAAPLALEVAASSVATRAGRLATASLAQLSANEERVVGWRRLMSAYDVERQLERGYTLTTDANGSVLRAGAGLASGDRLRTRFADGTVESVVRGRERS